MQDIPTISIVTRTAGRPGFLRRCYGCIARAAPQGTQWIVVDDFGEDTGAIVAILDQAARDGVVSPELVISAAQNRAKAVNAGLDVARGEFVHVLDDDDTIAERFYDVTVNALREAPQLGSVATRARSIQETVDPSGTIFKQVKTIAHYPEVRAITLAGMALVQTTPTNSLLFRKSALDQVGRFDPSLPVCEDHEFLLRFLMQFDIGLLDQELAFFHQRVRDPSVPTAFQNSAVTRNFEAERAYFANAMLRRDLRDSRLGLGWLMAVAELSRGASKLDRLLSQLDRVKAFRDIYHRLRR